MVPRRAAVELPERFRARRHVANGGMASVWAAEDRTLGRTVAIKLLATGFLGDRDAVRRFGREARAAASLSSHPHVVTIFDVGEHEGRPFIVMEYMPGGSLADAISRDRELSDDDALSWLGEAAGALDFAHESGIVHRDVKPGNLLLDDRGRLAVTDFGIARVAFDATVTATGQVMGTAAYLSPEQAAGRPAGPASDRYALGVVAYELLTGKRPYPGGSFPAQALQHVEADPVPPSEAASRLPPAVDRVLLRSLDKDPEARWPTAAAMVGALEAALRSQEGDPTVALAPTQTTRPLRRAADPPPAPALTRERRTSGRRLLPAGLVLAGLLAAVLALAALGGGEDPPRQATAPTAPRTTPPSPQRTEAAQSAETVAALNDRGFALINAGRSEAAVPPLQQAVERCGDSGETVCAYAMYNLGWALVEAGRPKEAVPILERRLQIPNQQDVVREKLAEARRAAGASSAGPDAEPGGGRGRGNDGRRAGREGDDDD